MVAAWALQAVTMLYLGMRFANKVLLVLAYLLYYLTGFMVVKLNISDISTGSSYLTLLQQRFFSLGTFALALGAGYFISQKFSFAKASKSDSQSGDGAKITSEIFFYSAMVFAWVFCYLEFKSVAYLFFPPLRILLQGSLFFLTALLLLWRYRRKQQAWDLYGAAALLLAFLVQLVLVDIPFWDRSGGTRWFCCTFIRLPEYLILIGVLISGCRVLRSATSDMTLTRRIFAVSALCVWFIYSSFEVYFLLKTFLADFVSGGISIWWGLFGLLLLLYGLRKNIFPLRISALILLAFTAMKVIFIDLSHQDIIYRVIALIAIGLITLGGALIYIRSRIQPKSKNEE